MKKMSEREALIDLKRKLGYDAYYRPDYKEGTLGCRITTFIWVSHEVIERILNNETQLTTNTLDMWEVK